MRKSIQLLFTMSMFVLLVGTISALDKNVGLTPTQIDTLAGKGISNVSIIEYPCQIGVRCFAVEGDINQKLIDIPITVKDNYQNVKGQKVWNYRNITQNEVDLITGKALNKILYQQAKQPEPSYYPIPDNTDVKSKSIDIGKSITDWISKKIKQIGDVIGI